MQRVCGKLVVDRKAQRALVLAAMAAAGFVATAATATDTTYTWLGPATGGNASWTVAANWQGSVAPPTSPAVTGDHTILVFGGNLNSGTTAQSGTTSSVAGDYDIFQLVFNDYTVPAGVGTFVMNTTGTGSRILKLGAGGIIDNSIGGGTNNGSVTFNASNGSDRRLVLTADQTWNVVNAASTNNLIIKRVIDDKLAPTDTTSYVITKDGAGTLQLSGSNAWSGGMRIANGVVRIDTVQSNQFGTGTLWIDTANSTAISASGSATSSSPFSQTLINPIEFGGGGTFSLRGSWDIAFNGTIDFAGDKTWSVNAPAGGSFNGTAVPAGIHTVNANITGAGNWTKSGGGTLILNGDGSAFSGNLWVTNGVLSAGSFGQLGTALTPIKLGDDVPGAGTTAINSGTLLIRTAGQSTTRGISTGNGGGNLDFAGDVTVGPISGTGAFTKVGAGNLNTGQINIGGALTATTAKTTIAPGSGTNRINGATVLGGGTGAWTSTLDLNNNHLVVDYADAGPSPLPTVADQIKSGYHGGDWAGTGITSSAAAAASSTAHKTALGYGEASAVLGPSGGTFAGQTVDGSTVLVRYTYSGDANLDGTVDTVDFNALASNFGGTGKGWTQADFNYDGVVDTIDFNTLAANFGQQLADGGGGGGVGALVPEPSSVALLVGGGMFLAALQSPRRRSRT